MEYKDFPFTAFFQFFQAPLDLITADFENKVPDSVTEEEFFGSLDEASIMSLYNFYKRDFLLFGYDETLPDYLAMAGKNV